MHSFLLLEKADKRLLRRHDCLSLAPSFIRDLVTSANRATERGPSQTALTSKGLATALQARPQQVGTGSEPPEDGFQSGHGSQGARGWGSSHRGGTVAPPAPTAAVSPAGLANSSQALGQRGQGGEGRGPVMAPGSLRLGSMAGVFCHNLAERMPPSRGLNVTEGGHVATHQPGPAARPRGCHGTSGIPHAPHRASRP